jgi:raffinose/stachyose/melibiose transport system substrate-binding protein
MKSTRARSALLLGALSLVGTSVGLAASASASDEPVTIQWWHIQNTDPGMTDWQNMADAYMAEHPNVTIEITVMENEAFKAAIQTNIQAGDVPDLFQSWGGGVLLDQVNAGAVQDITDASAEFVEDLSVGAASVLNIDGVQYGLPYNQSLVGFWYNKDLFEQAGITETPTTWTGLLEVIQTLTSRPWRSAPATSGRRTSGTPT